MDDRAKPVVDILTGEGFHRCFDSDLPQFCCCPPGECADHQRSALSLDWLADEDHPSGGTYWWVRRFPSGREERDGPYINRDDAIIERHGFDGP